MSPILKSDIKRVRAECEKKGVLIVVEQTKDDTSWTLSNFSTGKSVIIGEMDIEVKPYKFVAAFKINVHRWNWAIDEGFTRDEIVEKLSSEVFSEISLKKIPSYLT